METVPFLHWSLEGVTKYLRLPAASGNCSVFVDDSIHISFFLLCIINSVAALVRGSSIEL
jgi:hypothetical protein